jgi:hypothetical protein
MARLIRRFVLSGAAVTLLAAGAASSGPIDSYPQVIGVRQLDVGFNLGEGRFKARVTLLTGEALDVPLASDADAEALLKLAQIASAPGVAMTATAEGRRVLSVQCTVHPSAP